MIWLLSSALSQMKKWILKTKVTCSSSHIWEVVEKDFEPKFSHGFYNAYLAYSSVVRNLRASYHF